MKTLEGNKLIAEFLGAYSHPDRIDADVLEYELYGIIECIEDGPDEKHFFHPEEMLFNSSWDWLMPVVEKIDSILADDDFVTITFNRCLVEVHNPETIFSGKKVDSLTIEGMGNTRIEATWNAVCEFIEWYNDNK